MSKTHWKSIADSSEFLGKQHFDPDKGDLIVTIDTLEGKDVFNGRGGKEMKRILHFMEPEVRPMILNATNGTMIENLMGTPYEEEWRGRKIALWVDPNVHNPSGKGNGGIRVRPYLPKVETLICADCGEPIKAYGKYSAKVIAERAMSKYNAYLCYVCAKAREEL